MFIVGCFLFFVIHFINMSKSSIAHVEVISFPDNEKSIHHSGRSLLQVASGTDATQQCGTGSQRCPVDAFIGWGTTTPETTTNVQMLDDLNKGTIDYWHQTTIVIGEHTIRIQLSKLVTIGQFFFYRRTANKNYYHQRLEIWTVANPDNPAPRKCYTYDKNSDTSTTNGWLSAPCLGHQAKHIWIYLKAGSGMVEFDAFQLSKMSCAAQIAANNAMTFEDACICINSVNNWMDDRYGSSTQGQCIPQPPDTTWIPPGPTTTPVPTTTPTPTTTPIPLDTNFLNRCGADSRQKCAPAVYEGFGTAVSKTVSGLSNLNNGDINGPYVTISTPFTLVFDFGQLVTVDIIKRYGTTVNGDGMTGVVMGLARRKEDGTMVYTTCYTWERINMPPIGLLSDKNWWNHPNCRGHTGHQLWVHSPANGFTPSFSQFQVLALTCPANSQPFESACVCNAGLVMQGCLPTMSNCATQAGICVVAPTTTPVPTTTPMPPCQAPPNFYCASPLGSTYLACSINSLSKGGQIDKYGCYCKAGYKGNQDSGCSACGNGLYCPENSSTHIFCPLNTNSLPLSSKISDCFPNPGFFGPVGVEPTPCPQDSYCPANVTQPQICPQHTGNGGQASALNQCIAKVGFYGQPGVEATQCAPGTSSPTAGMINCQQCDPGFTTTPATGFASCVPVSVL